MVQQTSLQAGHDITQRVAADLLDTWVRIWEEAIVLREANPHVAKLAVHADSDPAGAIRQIIPVLSLIHPQVAASVVVTCKAAVDELRRSADEAVTPPSDTGERVFVAVEGGRMRDVGGQQQQNRLAELEAQLEELQAENESLRQQLDHEVRGREADRTNMQAAATILNLRLDGIG